MGKFPTKTIGVILAATTLAASLLLAIFNIGPSIIVHRSRSNDSFSSTDQDEDEAVVIANNEESDVDSSTATTKKILNVENVMWSHKSGHLCFKSDGSFQSVLFISSDGSSDATTGGNSEEERDYRDNGGDNGDYNNLGLGGSGVFVQEYHHTTGKMHTYETFHVEALRAQAMESLGSVPKWVDALEGVKYECLVKGEEDDRAVRALQQRDRLDGFNGGNLDDVGRSGGERWLRREGDSRSSQSHSVLPNSDDLENEEDTDASIYAPKLLEQKEDGSSIWTVAGFVVEANKDLDPIAIIPPSENFDQTTNTIHSFQIPITSIESCTTELTGCDPELDSDDRSLPTLDPDVLSTAELELALSQHPDGRNSEHRERLLAVWGDFQNGVTGTNWCGVGVGHQDRSPCPGEDEDVTDLEADRACRRHDYGVFLGASSVTGIPRNECLIDADLVAATDNSVITAVFGKYGLAAASGCWSRDQYKCFKFIETKSRGYWGYGNYCEGKVARYGYNRYNGMSRDNSWGYRKPLYTCKGDIFSCDGDSCFARSPKAEDMFRLS